MNMPADPIAERRDLEVLEAINASPHVNQRTLAGETSMALGLVNSCLKRLVRKGLVKIKEAPGRRYLYYLTPKGMTEKTRLTYEYVSYSVHYYADARRRCRALFERLTAQGVREVAFLGRSDLAEIAYLSAQEVSIRLSAVYDDAHAGSDFFGTRVSGLDAIPSAAAPGKTVGDKQPVLIYTHLRAPSTQPGLIGLTFHEIFGPASMTS